MALVMSQMPDVWRKVLVEHVDDGAGRCRACRNANGETAAWPCQTFRVAQEAKWVAEGNLPGTGPHGARGPSATPRLSPLDEPHHGPAGGRNAYGETDRPGSHGGGFDTSGWDRPGAHGDGLDTGGWDRAGAHGFGVAGDRGLPGSHGAEYPGTTGGWDLPATGGGGLSWDLEGPMPTDPHADDAATAFGGPGASGPALASLPPLPPTAVAAPSAPATSLAPAAPSWRDDPLGPAPLDSAPFGGDAWARDPWSQEPRHPSWRTDESSADEATPYGSRVDAPYGSTFGVDDRPRGSRH